MSEVFLVLWGLLCRVTCTPYDSVTQSLRSVTKSVRVRSHSFTRYPSIRISKSSKMLCESCVKRYIIIFWCIIFNHNCYSHIRKMVKIRVNKLSKNSWRTKKYFHTKCYDVCQKSAWPIALFSMQSFKADFCMFQ